MRRVARVASRGKGRGSRGRRFREAFLISAPPPASRIFAATMCTASAFAIVGAPPLLRRRWRDRGVTREPVLSAPPTPDRPRLPRPLARATPRFRSPSPNRKQKSARGRPSTAPLISAILIPPEALVRRMPPWLTRPRLQHLPLRVHLPQARPIPPQGAPDLLRNRRRCRRARSPTPEIPKRRRHREPTRGKDGALVSR